MSEDDKLNSDGDRYHYDGFFIKEFLDSIKHGNLQHIIDEIKKHSLNISIVKDCIHHHNALFYSTLIKDDAVYVRVKVELLIS